MRPADIRSAFALAQKRVDEVDKIMSLATLVLVSAAIALASTSSSSKEEPFDSGELPIFHSDKVLLYMEMQ